jgi:hypothetical protein
MTTHHSEPVVCECGHEGTLHWSENDQPFIKQWAKWSISGFEGEGFYIEGFSGSANAIKKINSKRPKCGAVGKLKNA